MIFPFGQKFWSYFQWITVEPIAFLAIFALYIEFPAIQDLIYTQSCVQTIIYHQTHALTMSNLTEPTYNLNAKKNFNLDSKNVPVHGNNDIHNDDPFEICDRFNRSLIPSEWQHEIGEANSKFWLRYQLVICLFCVFSCPYWGGLSDHIGRLIPLTTPLMTAALCNSLYILYSRAIHRWPGISLEWLMSGAVLTGLSGGQAVVMMNSFGYLSDTTDHEIRSKRITILEAIIFTSNSIGFFVNGLLMKLSINSPKNDSWWLILLDNRHLMTFSICLFLNMIGLLYAFVRLCNHKSYNFINYFQREQNEILSSDQNVHAHSQHMQNSNINSNSNVTGAELVEVQNSEDENGKKKVRTWITLHYYANVFDTLARARNSRPLIHCLLLAAFISASSLAITMSLMFNYVKREPFSWPTSYYSLWNGWSSVTRGIALIALSLVMRFSSRWNVPDALVAAIGFASRGIGMTMIGLAQSTSTINYSLIIAVLSEFTMPPIRSILSKLVPRQEVCKVYACIGASQSLCFALGNLVIYAIYTSIITDTNFFRLSFIGSASAQGLAIIIMIFVYRGQRQLLSNF